MQNFLFTLLLLFPAPALSAQEKISTLPNQLTNHQTRAVVVGISDYQDAEIPDLQYAHKDAEAFANWLHSPAGGNVPADNIRLLLNEKATAAQFTAAIDWLIEQTTAGDRAVIYFSGHGDMEAKLLNQLGFLLLWDSPAHAYLAGALPVDILKQVVTTLSVEKKANVLVVADACRAGKLAGSNVVGTQLTNANLAKQFANEQKILSCQADEYSIEGRQWGGGRGAFSWHLVNGLYGLADLNGDNQIILMEIGRFLEDRVTPEVQPLSQVPLTVGDKTEVIGRVDEIALANLKKGKEFPLANFSGVEQRGLVQETLAKTSPETMRLYESFLLALKEKRLLEPAGNCAEDFYGNLLRDPGIKALHNYLRRNYAAALQDDSQQFINTWLAADVQQMQCNAKNLNMALAPRLLDRASELLGNQHYLWRILQARRLFFESYLLTNMNSDEAQARKCLALCRQSLELEPKFPLPWHWMSLIYTQVLRQPDSALVCAREAHNRAPSWVLPFADLGYELAKLRRFELSSQVLQMADAIDSLHPFVINNWARWHWEQGGKVHNETAHALYEKYRACGGVLFPCWHLDYAVLLKQLGRFEDAEAEIFNALALDSMNMHAWSNLGSLYQTTRRFADAELAFKHALALDSTLFSVWNNLGTMYFNMRRYTEAEQVLKRSLDLKPSNVSGWANLGSLYTNTQRYAEAEAALQKALALDSTLALIWNNLGFLYNSTKRYAEAEPLFKKAIALDSLRINVNVWNNLGSAYLHTGRYAEAEEALLKAIATDTTFLGAYWNIGRVYFKTNRPDDARQYFLKSLALDPNYSGGILGLAYLSTHALMNADASAKDAFKTEAFGYVEQAIKIGAPYSYLQSNTELAPLRALPEWKALMKKYFPDQAKD